MSKKNRTPESTPVTPEAPEAPESTPVTPEAPETAQTPESTPVTPEAPETAPDEFSTLNSYGRLARYAIEHEETALKGAVSIGKAMNAYAVSHEVTVKKVATKMHGKIERLAINTLQQYASIAKLADEIGHEFYDLGTFRNAQVLKGILVKVKTDNGKAGMVDCIRRFVKGESLDAIRERYGLKKEKGIKTDDKDAIQVAKNRGDDPAEFEKDLAALRQLKLSKEGFRRFAEKLFEDNMVTNFMNILREVGEARGLTANAEKTE